MKIKLTNFRSHKSLTVDIVPGKVTVFKAPNNWGKSNVVRALWAVLNNQRDTECVTFNEKQSVIQIDNVEKWKGAPKKKSVRNEYVVPGYPDPFRRLGLEVPEAVYDELGIHPIIIGSGKTKKTHFLQVQLAEQAGQFLVGFTEPDTARLLSIITGFDQATDAADRAEKERKELLKKLEFQKDGIKSIKDSRLESALMLKEHKKAWRSLGPKYLEIQELREGVRKASELLVEYKRISEYIRMRRKYLVGPRKPILEGVDKQSETYVEASRLMEGYRRIQVKKPLAPLPKMPNIEDQANKYAEAQDLLGDRQVIHGQIDICERLLATHKCEHTNMKVELEELLDETDLCPLIGGPWKPGCKDLIKE